VDFEDAIIIKINYLSVDTKFVVHCDLIAGRLPYVLSELLTKCWMRFNAEVFFWGYVDKLELGHYKLREFSSRT